MLRRGGGSYGALILSLTDVSKKLWREYALEWNCLIKLSSSFTPFFSGPPHHLQHCTATGSSGLCPTAQDSSVEGILEVCKWLILASLRLIYRKCKIISRRTLILDYIIYTCTFALAIRDYY